MMCPQESVIGWLLGSDEPWTRYRTLIDLLGRAEDDADAAAARCQMLAHPQVQALIAAVAAWPGGAIARHNDAGHPIHKLALLADFGVRATDSRLAAATEAVLVHQAPEGAFQSVVNIPAAFGGTGEDAWAWMACDAPTLVYALAALGLAEDPRVQRAAQHLAGLVTDNGWRCSVAPELGRFHGPGRRTDPCPIANLLALKALAQMGGLADCPAVHAGVEMLLGHWAARGQSRPYLFGVGSDYRKLKYPFVWYDGLHAADVLSRLPAARADQRLSELVDTVSTQADADGRYAAGSMYRAWQGWSFADKKRPSPWLTLLVLRVQRRSGYRS
jgi:hypothetical protein